MRVLIIGYAGCGKTIAGDMLASYSNSKLKSVSTSDILVEKYCEANNLDCEHIKQNKSNYRKQLWEFGREIQEKDPKSIVKAALFAAALNDLPKPWNAQKLSERLAGDQFVVVTGVRNPDEIVACRNFPEMFDIIIWINRPGVERGLTDFLIQSDADVVIENTGTLLELRDKILQVCRERVGTLLN